VYGSVSDPRMGSFNPQIRCKTCDCTYAGSGSKMDDCPGHFGHIELVRPVFHCGFIDEVVKILRCVCYHCSRLLLDERIFKDKRALQISDPETRLRCIHDCCRGKKQCKAANVDDSTKLLNQVGLNEEDVSNLSVDALTNELKGLLGAAAVNGNGAEAISAPGCGGLMPKYTRKGMEVQIEYPEMEVIPGTGDKIQKLSAQRAYDILRGISDEDVRKLGFNPQYARPEWFLVSVLPVPPPHVRPAVAVEGGTSSEDDLTHQLINIVKVNLKLEDSINKGDPPHVIETLTELLQNRVTAFFDNERQDTPTETQRTGRPLKSIRQRLRGKEGRIRGNLMGKRVDFSARTVITADPNLSIDQVGVPKSVATRLTLPVPVTPFNIAELRELVNRSIEKGPAEWPGAVCIIRSDHSRQYIQYCKNVNDIALEYGWIVERHLRDDDIVLFNRQPSLHKMSIMGHRAKVLDWSTFRLNLSVTTPYNADFDGDEMNLHVPQSITARADAQELMMVPRNIVTPQSNRNVMGIVQDALLGVTRMTARDIFIEKDVVMQIMMWIPTWDGNLPTPAILKPRPLWTGKQMFSLICPKINYRGKSIVHDEKTYLKLADPFNYDDSMVLIHSGMLMHGIVDKNIVGTSGGSIVHICWLEKGWEETRSFMNQVQTVVNSWMVNNSYSVGVSDTVADAKTISDIHDVLNDAKDRVAKIVQIAQLGKLIMQKGKPFMDSFEVSMNEVLNGARDTVGAKAHSSLHPRNAIKGTVTAGSKGSKLNISQIIACVGQQNVQGKRIQSGFQQRTLPHFCKDDYGMASRGFVENSYLRGLTPQEFFFHAMGGREGCIDTAVKTSETGYIQRRLVKAMETVMARYDTTLRNSRGCIMQFLYGEDGMDAQRIEKQFFDSHKMTTKEFKDAHYLDLSADNLGQLKYFNTVTNEPAYYMTKQLIEKCRNDSELRAMLDDEFEQLLRDKENLRVIMGCRGSNMESENFTYLPVNIDRLIWNAQRQFRINTREPTSLHPRVVLETINRLCKDGILVVPGDDHLSREAQDNATFQFQILLRSKLATKRVLREYRLTEESLRWIEGSIISDFNLARVNPGEMCGVLAAQSIGEPATQMTLNTFHNSGIGAKNVTLGVPRLNELLNVSRNIKTPSLVITPRIPDDKSEADSLRTLEYTTLGDVTIKTEIYYDPNPKTTVIAEDKELVESFFEAEDINTEDMSPWLLRIVLDHKINDDPLIPMDYIESKILEFFNNAVHVVYSDNNAELLVLRIRILISDEDRQGESEEVASGSEDHEILRRMQKNLLENLHLRGVAGIKKVYLSEKKVMKWVENSDKGFEPRSEWLLETDGTNLAEVMTDPRVNHTTVFSNDVIEMFTVLGIEAARASLFNEMRNVLSFDNAYVNYRHVACLADCMTVGGFVMAVSRHGINSGESGPMLRASFEETVEVFMRAAMYSESDVLNGVTENVMLGQLGRLGTGMVDLLLDTDKLSKAIPFRGEEEIAEMDHVKQQGATFAAKAFSATPFHTPFSQSTPSSMFSPAGLGSITPDSSLAFTPAHSAYFADSQTPAGYSPYMSMASPGRFGISSPYSSRSPSRSIAAAATAGAYSMYASPGGAGSPAYSPTSPAYSPTRFAAMHPISFFVSV
jgi:DNA-directed RNA polymerase II subunit RPB1